MYLSLEGKERTAFVRGLNQVRNNKVPSAPEFELIKPKGEVPKYIADLQGFAWSWLYSYSVDLRPQHKSAGTHKQIESDRVLADLRIPQFSFGSILECRPHLLE